MVEKMIESKQHLRSIRSFVMRAGRTTMGQEKALQDLWPVFGLELKDGLIDDQHIFGRQASTVLEIGFGMGESLISMASAAPELNFIGIEVHRPGVGRLLSRIAEEVHSVLGGSELVAVKYAVAKMEGSPST